jgi:flagellar hook-associated protein 3 FlgL
MRIATDTIFNNMESQIQNLDSAQSTLQGQLATGLSISQPSDNPTAISSVLNLISEDAQTSQYSANATTALQVSQASYAGLTQLNQLSNSVDQIATEANNGTDSPSQLQDYATEINQYLEQTLQLGNSTFEGNYLYAGTANNAPPFQATRDAQGQITAVAYVGNSSQESIPVSTSTSISPTTDGTTNQSIADFMNQLVSLGAALQTANTSGIATAQAQLETTSDSFVSAAAQSGAVQSGIESAQTLSTSLGQNLESIISGESSADVATTDAKLTEAQTSYQAVLEASARVMQTSLLNYLSTTTA